MEEGNLNPDPEGLRCFPWRISYRTSSTGEGDRPLDILHDFYIPALSRCVRYDRVAGYFRSTSLAAASQGFSAFAAKEGRMRLIVGADLDPEDVFAILCGMEERLENALNKELEHPEKWPDEVARGVELLSWMVAHDRLEVKVAFRVNAKTGAPLVMDAVEDGYVHMKWAVFADMQGNRVYITGSLNESKTALTLNAENIDVHCDWRGDIERDRVEETDRDFGILWTDRNPSMRVLTLPEAVRRRLIAISEKTRRPCEIDGSSSFPREIPPPSLLELLRFAILRDGPMFPGGRYVGMETSPVAPWPHQAVVARRLIDTWPYSFLLCDEVGLGKTIEAGLAIRSLYLSGIVRRVLICAPAAITRQWQREMASKFFLPFGRVITGPNIRHAYLLPFEEERQASSMYEPDLVIVSTGLVARNERIRELRNARGFDIALVDEAHYARRKNPTQGGRGHPEYGNLYRVIQQSLIPKSMCLLLATATPMQLDPVEAADLIHLTRRVGAFQSDPGLMAAYYEILGRLVCNQEPHQKEWEFLRQAALAARDQDPVFWRFVEQAVIDGRMRLAARQWLDWGHTPRGADRSRVLRLIFTASPLSRVMLRHNRSLLEIYREKGQLTENLPEREILPVPRIVFTSQERKAYDQMEEYCRVLASRMSGHEGEGQRVSIGFYLSFLRKRFASSLFAISETLRRRRQKVEATMRNIQGPETAELLETDFEFEEAIDDWDDDEEVVSGFLKNRGVDDLEWERDRLTEMLLNLSDLSGPSSKMAELLRILDRRRIRGIGRIKQTVIFTQFYDTLTDITGRLLRADPCLLIGTYSGQGGQCLDPNSGRMAWVDRDEVKHRFLREELDVLVCTDAAAEGLNLQTADMLVNFDLPWNPMKVEQRIGRIDRIGQKHGKIYVLNMCYADSVEEIVYDRLLRRLASVGAIVGTQQISMLPVTAEEFQQLAENRLKPEELEKIAKERALLAKRRSESMEIPPLEIYDIYMRLFHRDDDRRPPVVLEDIWKVLSESGYLYDLGCRVDPNDKEKRIMTLAGIDGIPDGTAITISRSIYDAGVPGLEGKLHFATYGDPAFQAILDQTARFSLPGCIRRIEALIEGCQAKVVGYAAAVADKNGRERGYRRSGRQGEEWRQGGQEKRGEERKQCEKVVEWEQERRDLRFITSMKDLEGLDIDETAELTEEDTEPLRGMLIEMTGSEFQTIQAVPNIERLNEHAGRFQAAANLLVMKDILGSRKRMEKGEALIWRELSALEAIFKEKDVIRARLPAVYARQMTGLLLFSLVLPSAGEDAYIDCTRPLLFSAMEMSYRLANGMKIKKSDLSTDLFLARLDKEIEREIGHIRDHQS